MKVQINDPSKINKKKGGLHYFVEIDNFDAINLFHTLSLIILPSLKKYKECSPGVPGSFGSQDEWRLVLQKMINAFEIIVKDEHYTGTPKHAIVDEGLELFGKYFRCLWY